MLPGGLTHGELEHQIESLRPFPPLEVGTAAWKSQRARVEVMNVISHQAASEKKSDVVLELLVSHNKLPVLLHELLVCEAVRRHVYPQAAAALERTPAGAYMYLQYESVLLNLLECLMFSADAVTGFDDDILELMDYAWRTVSAVLLADSRRINDIPAPDAAAPERLAAISDVRQRFAVAQRETMIARAMSCVSLLWFVVERLQELPLAAARDVLSKHDLIVGFANLLEAQPWLRRGPGGAVEKFSGGRYNAIPAANAMMIVPTEAHAWFALHYLLCDRACRAQYHYTTFRKEQILRVKRLLNETIVDQIPALVDVQRALEELSFLQPPSGTEEKFKSTALLVESVPRLQAAIDGERAPWADKLTEAFLGPLTRDPSVAMEDARVVSGIFDAMSLDGVSTTAPRSATAAVDDDEVEDVVVNKKGKTQLMEERNTRRLR
jgi:hypothetical protein